MKKYETYKDSGIEWIGEIPEGWEAKRLKYFATQITTPSSDSRKIGLENIESKTGKYLPTDSEFEGNGVEFRTGDIVYGKLRPYLQKVWKAEFDGNAVGDFFVYRATNDVISSYLKYVFLSDIFTSIADGSTYGAKMPRVSSEFLANILWYLPSIEEQKAIAAYLDHKVASIDKSVDTINTQIEDLRSYRQSVISEAVTKGLDPNAPMKDSGIEWIGEIPEEWEVRKLKTFLEKTSDNMKVGPFGSALSGNDFTSEGYWVYNQRTILDNNFNTNTVFISEEKYKEMQGFVVKEGDMLITTRGTIGKVAIVPKIHQQGIIHPCVIRFRVDEETVDKQFLRYIFNDSRIVTEQVNFNSNATTIEVIYSYTLKELYFPLPPLSEQQSIANYLDTKASKIDAAIKSLETQRDDLNAMKQSVISEAVTGKIDVRDWYKEHTK